MPESTKRADGDIDEGKTASSDEVSPGDETEPRIPRQRSAPRFRISRPTRTSPATAAVIALSVLTYTALGYRRRWIADDGMIAVRTARQIMAGNGPVYSTYERAETDTSTLWTWLTAFGGWVSGVDVARVAVLTGLLCAVSGVTLALIATSRFHHRLATRAAAPANHAAKPSGPRRSRAWAWIRTPSSGQPVPAGSPAPAPRLLLPAGVLVLLGVSPFWDYATSGLESGLGFLWIGACWYVLVSWCAPPLPGVRGPRARSQYAAAVLFGLAPLVRPEFALLGAVFVGAAWLLNRPRLRRALALTATAAVLPIAAEIFRAGYYGTLVPLPALTKSASSSHWSRGIDYAHEFVVGYLLWIPLGILAGFLVAFAARGVRATPERVLLATPLTAGLLLCLYVVNVGGDFMHARMMLPVVFVLLLPLLLLPAVRFRVAVPVVAALAVWAAAIAAVYPVGFRDKAHAVSEDERLGYQEWLGRTNPDASGPYLEREAGIAAALHRYQAQGRKMLTSEGGVEIPLNPALPFDAAVVAGRLGAVGAVTPLDDVPVDTLGLSYPLGARITPTNPGRPGHEKVLPWAWILADYGDPAVVDHTEVIPGTSPTDVAAARHAMSCGALKELIDSTRRPMTPGRFWANLTGAFGRTTLVVPADPVAAERKFCL